MDEKYPDILCFVRTSYNAGLKAPTRYSQFIIYDFEEHKLFSKKIEWEKGILTTTCELMAMRALLNHINKVHIPYMLDIVVIHDSQFVDEKLRNPNSVSSEETRKATKDCLGSIQGIIMDLGCDIQFRATRILYGIARHFI